MDVYHADLNEAQADPAVSALFAPRAGVTPFDRIDWLQQMAERCLDPTRCFIAVARDGDAVAALPLYRTPAGLTALGNWYSFIARPRYNDPALLTAILRHASTVGALNFGPLPDREAGALLHAARKSGWIACLTPATINHVLHTKGRDFAKWWATRPGPLRETVRRKSRKITTRIARALDEAEWDTYAAIYAQSWKPTEASPEFLRRFAIAESRAGRLRLGIASLDGLPVAAQLWTIEGGTAFIHKLAHLPAAAAHSPGTVLSHALFAMAFDDDRVDLIDFGTGDDRYKRDWMEETRQRWQLEAYHPRAVRHWPALGKLVVRTTLARARRLAAVEQAR